VDECQTPDAVQTSSSSRGYDRRNAKGSIQYERWGVTSIYGAHLVPHPQRISDVSSSLSRSARSEREQSVCGRIHARLLANGTFYDAWTGRPGREFLGHTKQARVLDRVTATGPATDYERQIGRNFRRKGSGEDQHRQPLRRNCTTLILVPFRSIWVAV